MVEVYCLFDLDGSLGLIDTELCRSFLDSYLACSLLAVRGLEGDGCSTCLFSGNLTRATYSSNLLVAA